ncbi:MAG: class I SAM-dependent methyltransferase [Firmicutes bacterium]|nr:class I SAM-dependent methyltransferase [[Eubacterium] siraeum]MCM1489115.1 class I SAM-dependent methyltransferase [Bacillota bacterium]
MMGYADFARFYDLLTCNVDYRKLSRQYAGILAERGVSSGRLLDLACGSGNLAAELQKAGFEVVGADLSEEMLTAAALKSNSIQWIRADMTDLPFKNEFDGVVCGLDSINHLPDLNAIAAAFQGIYSSLKNGGVFAADLNTPYKHREILADNAFNFDYDGLFCAWQNELSENDPLNRVDMFLDFFEEQQDGSYIRYQDSLSEIAPEPSQIEQLMRDSGFVDVKLFDCPSGKSVGKHSEKIFVAGVKAVRSGQV